MKLTIFDNLPDKVFVNRTRGGIVFNWSRKGVGFGQLTLVAKHGRLHVDSETMGDEFCLDVIKQALKEAYKL